MRIAQISPLFESVPPKLYGGTERVVSYLTEQLVRMGHDVTLFASSDSVTAAELVSPGTKALRLNSKDADAVAYHLVMLEQVMARGSWRPLVTAALLLASAYGLGYALAAIQLVPWAEAGRLSVRAAGADFDFVFRTSTTGAEWLLFLFPYLLGAHGGSLFASGAWTIQTAVRTWEHSGYVGVLPLALAPVALWHLAELTLNPTTPAEGSAGAAGAPRLPGRAGCLNTGQGCSSYRSSTTSHDRDASPT